MHLERNESFSLNCFEPPPGFGVLQPSGAFGADASEAKAVEGHRSPRRYRARAHSFTFAARTEGDAPHLVLVYFAATVTGRDNCARRSVASASEAMMAPPFKSTEAISADLPCGRAKTSVLLPLPDA